MANSLTAEQRKRITSREQKSCKSQSSPFSSPSTMQRKERDVKENGSISLYSFLPTRWGKWCVSRQAHFSDYRSLSLKQEAGCQFAFLQHSDEAVSLANFFISQGVITDHPILSVPSRKVHLGRTQSLHALSTFLTVPLWMGVWSHPASALAWVWLLSLHCKCRLPYTGELEPESTKTGG